MIVVPRRVIQRAERHHAGAQPARRTARPHNPPQTRLIERTHISSAEDSPRSLLPRIRRRRPAPAEVAHELAGLAMRIVSMAWGGVVVAQPREGASALDDRIPRAEWLA